MGRWDATHAALREAALELFGTLGYDATTTAQVARRAGVTEMTLFRHFPTKEALLLSDPYDPLLAEAVRTRPPGEAPMASLVAGIGQAWTRLPDADLAGLSAVLAIVRETPGLRGALERNASATSDALAEALIARGATPVAAAVATSAAIAGLSAALLAWNPEERSLSAHLSEALDALAGR